MRSIKIIIHLGLVLFTVMLVTMSSTSAIASSGDTVEVRVPSSVQGLFVNAICGTGCVPANQRCEVYILTPKEFQLDHGRDVLQKYSKGETPLLVKGLTPGAYMVGVKALVDPALMPASLAYGANQEQSARVSRQVGRFFIDDMRESNSTWQEIGFEKVDGGMRLVTKGTHTVAWYSVTVYKKKLTPVIAAFLPTTENLEKWAKSYPFRPTFVTELERKTLATLWQTLEGSSPLVPVGFFNDNTKSLLTDLLIRGGKIIQKIPNGNLVVAYNADGLPEVLYRVKLANSSSVSPKLLPNKRIPQHLREGSSDSIFPPYKGKLQGQNEVRIRNVNPFAVKVALRCQGEGLDFSVAPNAVKSIRTRNGRHDFFFIYSNEPKALYQGESISLENNGVEVQLVKVVGGNYAINRVK